MMSRPDVTKMSGTGVDGIEKLLVLGVQVEKILYAWCTGAEYISLGALNLPAPAITSVLACHRVPEQGYWPFRSLHRSPSLRAISAW
jgi:hypothetical protein